MDERKPARQRRRDTVAPAIVAILLGLVAWAACRDELAALFGIEQLLEVNPFEFIGLVYLVGMAGLIVRAMWCGGGR